MNDIIICWEKKQEKQILDEYVKEILGTQYKIIHVEKTQIDNFVNIIANLENNRSYNIIYEL